MILLHEVAFGGEAMCMIPILVFSIGLVWVGLVMHSERGIRAVFLRFSLLRFITIAVHF